MLQHERFAVLGFGSKQTKPLKVMVCEQPKNRNGWTTAVEVDAVGDNLASLKLGQLVNLMPKETLFCNHIKAISNVRCLKAAVVTQVNQDA